MSWFVPARSDLRSVRGQPAHGAASLYPLRADLGAMTRVGAEFPQRAAEGRLVCPFAAGEGSKLDFPEMPEHPQGPDIAWHPLRKRRMPRCRGPRPELQAPRIRESLGCASPRLLPKPPGSLEPLDRCLRSDRPTRNREVWPRASRTDWSRSTRWRA